MTGLQPLAQRAVQDALPVAGGVVEQRKVEQLAAIAQLEAACAGWPEPARSRAGWTWYIPVRLQDDGAVPLAHPLPLRSFSVSLTARSDGFIVMDERDETWPADTLVTVQRFLGGV